jgi:hypothetical protein
MVLNIRYLATGAHVICFFVNVWRIRGFKVWDHCYAMMFCSCGELVTILNSNAEGKNEGHILAHIDWGIIFWAAPSSSSSICISYYLHRKTMWQISKNISSYYWQVHNHARVYSMSLGWWKVFKLSMCGCLKIILKEVASGVVYKEAWEDKGWCWFNSVWKIWEMVLKVLWSLVNDSLRKQQEIISF